MAAEPVDLPADASTIAVAQVLDLLDGRFNTLPLALAASGTTSGWGLEPSAGRAFSYGGQRP